MTEEIINSDGSRNWEANILLDNIKRLEQDSKQLTQWLDEARKNADFWCDKCTSLEQENKELKEETLQWKQIKDMANNNTYRSALDTIQRMVLSAWEQGKYLDGGLYNDLTNEFAKINEVLQ